MAIPTKTPIDDDPSQPGPYVPPTSSPTANEPVNETDPSQIYGIPAGSGSAYTDPKTGGTRYIYADFGSGDPNGLPGRWGLLHGLSDPDSGVSKNFYYGGSKGFDVEEYNRNQQNANNALNRSAPDLDFNDANNARMYQDTLLTGLANAVKGDPNSVAQNDMRNLYNQGNAQAMSGAAGARGGLAARALANRTAMNQLGDNQQAYNIGSDQLMNQERMNAMGLMSGISNAMRTGDQATAFGYADIKNKQADLNDKMAQNYINRGIHNAGKGMEGEMAHESTRRDVLANNLGFSNTENKMNDQHNATMTNTIIGAGQGTAQSIAELIAKRNKVQ